MARVEFAGVRIGDRGRYDDAVRATWQSVVIAFDKATIVAAAELAGAVVRRDAKTSTHLGSLVRRGVDCTAFTPGPERGPGAFRPVPGRGRLRTARGARVCSIRVIP